MYDPYFTGVPPADYLDRQAADQAQTAAGILGQEYVADQLRSARDAQQRQQVAEQMQAQAMYEFQQRQNQQFSAATTTSPPSPVSVPKPATSYYSRQITTGFVPQPPTFSSQQVGGKAKFNVAVAFLVFWITAMLAVSWGAIVNQGRELPNAGMMVYCDFFGTGLLSVVALYIRKRWALCLPIAWVIIMTIWTLSAGVNVE